MTRTSASQALIDSLRRESVQHLFGLIGSDLIPVFDVLRDTKEIRTIQGRHESAVGHMADGYARVLGKHGVCMVHNGPGLTNIMTSVAVAYRAFSPIVVLSGAPTLGQYYRDTIQEVDQLALTKAIVKWNGFVTSAERIPEMIRYAFRVASSGRKGPVHLDIPRDLLLLKSIDVDFREDSPEPVPPDLAQDDETVEAAARLLLSAQSAVMVAGGGVVSSGASDEVQLLSEMLTIPVATSFGHLDAFRGDHPLMLGQLGREGSELAQRVVQSADVVLALGTRLSGFTTFFGYDFIPRQAKIIQIDIEPRELGRNYSVSIAVQGDARAFTRALIRAVQRLSENKLMPNGVRLEEVANLRGRLSKEKEEEPRHGSTPEYPIKPQLIFRELSQILTRKDIVVLDEGNAVSYAYHHLKFFEPRTLVAPLDLACIGSGYPTALGAKVARPDRRVFAVCGDGGFIMALHELATAVQYDIKVIAVVLNNNSWVAEKAYQKYYYSGRYFGVDLLNPSFAQVARDFGLTGIRVERQGDLRAGLLEAVESSKPSLVEVMVDPEELNPPARRDIMRA